MLFLRGEFVGTDQVSKDESSKRSKEARGRLSKR